MSGSAGAPRVDVLITVYNLVDYLERTLESVLAQQAPFAFRVLIGDDGSTDGSLEIAKRWQARYPNRVFVWQQPRDAHTVCDGLIRASQNRLFLLEKVNSEYFIFLDGDDFYLDSHKLQRQVECLDKPENADCIACAHNILWYWGEGDARNHTESAVPRRAGKVSGRYYWKNCYVHPDTVLCRSSYLRGVPACIKPRHFDDNFITFSMLQQGKLYYLPEPMVAYRQTAGGLWAGADSGMRELRELMCYEMETRMAPTWRRVSMIRHCAQFRAFARGRVHLGEKARQHLARCAEDDFRGVNEWVQYSALPLACRARLCVFRLRAEALRVMGKLPRLPAKLCAVLSQRLRGTRP